MLPEVENFISYIKDYKITRSVDDSEYDTIFKWHKNRLNECYHYLKYLSMRNDILSIKEDINAIKKITLEAEENFTKWKGIYVEENN